MRVIYYNGNQYFKTPSGTIVRWQGTESAQNHGESYQSAWKILRNYRLYCQLSCSR